MAKTERDALKAIRDFPWDAGDSETEAIALEKIQAIAAAQLEGEKWTTGQDKDTNTVRDRVKWCIAEFLRGLGSGNADELAADLADEVFEHLGMTPEEQDAPPPVRASKEMIEEARELYQKDGEIEIDPDARESRGEGNEERGAYVQAWVWVPDKETEET
jgi:hypothetical protein